MDRPQAGSATIMTPQEIRDMVQNGMRNSQAPSSPLGDTLAAQLNHAVSRNVQLLVTLRCIMDQLGGMECGDYDRIPTSVPSGLRVSVVDAVHALNALADDMDGALAELDRLLTLPA